MKNLKNIVTVIVFIAFFASVSLVCIFKNEKEFSDSERRALAKLPPLSTESVFGGAFMSDFETYAQDQFPLRDSLRTLKALFSTKVLNKADNNNFYSADGHISKLDNEENPYMTDYAAKLFEKIINENIKGKNSQVYFSIVPDKNMFMAKKNGYPSLDYEGFIKRMREKTPFMKYIDITPLLSLDDYYYSDSHWRQEKIVDIAEKISGEMGADVRCDYDEIVLDNPFYGVYASQSALPVEPDTIKYLTNDTIENCTVTYYGSASPKKGEVYDMEKAYGKDPYEMFFSGSAPVVVVENPRAEGKRELIIFRDSFGASLSPLMIEGYGKITLLDIRYVQSSFIKNFATFENSDILFLYSSALLNSSTAMK